MNYTHDVYNLWDRSHDCEVSITSQLMDRNFLTVLLFRHTY